MSGHTRVIVTGSAGFIGYHLTKKLLGLGYDIIGIDDLSYGSEEKVALLEKDKDYLHLCLDIREQETFKVFKDFKPQFVFHTAAISSVPLSVLEPENTYDVNVGGTKNLIDAAIKNKVSRIIFSSSSSVYGDTDNLPTSEENAKNPKSPYAEQKLACEFLLKEAAQSNKIDTASLRYFNVYGPGQSINSSYSAVIPAFSKALKEGDQVTIFGDGKQSRDFVHVNDVVDANILAAFDHLAIKGESYNVCSQTSLSLLDLATAMGIKNILFADKRPGDVFATMGCLDKISKRFGFKPKINLLDGIKELI